MTDLTDERLRDFVLEHYADQNMNHADFRVEAFRLAHRTNGGEAVAWQHRTQCCMCGKTGLSTTEGDGGTECQLSDGRWTCSADCYDRATLGTSGVRVKALEWDGNRAETPVGIYYVSRIGADWTVERGHTHAGDFYALKTGRATDFDAALVEGKAVAQLDCETRILAALEPSP